MALKKPLTPRMAGARFRGTVRTDRAADGEENLRSFGQYCICRFGRKWSEQLCWQIEAGIVPIGKNSETVSGPDRRIAEALPIKRMEFSRLDRRRICADAVIPVHIKVSVGEGTSEISDTLEQWYRFRSIITTRERGMVLEDDSISIYDKKDASPGQPLTEYLLPVLSAADMEDEANDILCRYYPEALVSGNRIDARLLAYRLGLSVLEVPLEKESNLMGKAVFCTGEIEAGNEIVMVEPGTILVNTGCVRSKEESNITIVHECSHHHEHDLFVWAQMLEDEKCIGIDCPLHLEENRQSPLFWAERQARMLSYRILLHRTMIKRYVSEFQAEYEEGREYRDKGEMLCHVIHRLAATCQVSLECARIRMLELGYKEVEGVLNYVDGRYVPPYFFPEDILAEKQTFVISLLDAAREYARNTEFRELVESGRYVYVEGKLCANTPEYVVQDESGRLCMTPYARENTHVCCLRFERSYQREVPGYVWGQFNREIKTVSDRGKTVVCPQCAAEPGLVGPEEFKQMAVWITKVKKEIAPMSFLECLNYLMKVRGLTGEGLEEQARVSARTISRMRNDEDYAVTKQTVVALAVGLHLPYIIGVELMGKAGLAFRNTDEDNVYQMILCSMTSASIDEVNECLVGMNYDPLTKLAAAM